MHISSATTPDSAAQYAYLRRAAKAGEGNIDLRRLQNGPTHAPRTHPGACLVVHLQIIRHYNLAHNPLPLHSNIILKDKSAAHSQALRDPKSELHIPLMTRPSHPRFTNLPTTAAAARSHPT